MPQFFLNKRLILLLVSIIFLVALIGYSLKEDRQLTWPEQFVKDSTGLFQTVFHKPAQYVAGFFENVGDLKNTYEENKLLKSKIDEHMKIETELQALRRDNEKLREELGAQESLREYNPIPAALIARNPDPGRWFDLITIDKGSQHGVEKDMAVITNKGLIGKVKSTSKFNSTVQLLSSPDRKNRIAAEIQGKDGQPNIFGLIEGYDEKKKALLLKKIESDVKIEKGQKVVTSGSSGIFPEGLVIGEVLEVEPDSYGLSQMAYIKPEADLYDIDRVFVTDRVKETIDITNMDPEEEEES
ncbi:rod shape-determining protein MreC [Metabacillus indicus]|uniref:rod shape-determining protein MreC n=1 Tax=Metabacillus indicus TaxID=246786 RepID=UPI002A025811|nr:rod shape-determining protein MreC [Metabacillus indicus]MDX8289997.1 rod shape-determining protein MreC [Metabacillus indicus]